MGEPSRHRPPSGDAADASQSSIDAPTERVPKVEREAGPETPSTLRLFGTPSFFRLWLAQVVSSLGDWIGFVAITALAARVGGSSPEVAITLVLSARLVPGFFLGPVAGVLVDRWDRKKVMVVCDVGRGLVLALLPLVDTVVGLVFASLLLEVMTLLWSPAKEASVPNLVRREFLTTANSLSLVAAYGTFPIGSALFAALAGVATWLSGFQALRGLSQESLAFYFDVVTFFLSAVMISTLALPRHGGDGERPTGAHLKRSFEELVEGWRFIRDSALVRSVILGIATGLVGGGMVVPLGPIMSQRVFGGGSAGFGLLLTAMGTGVAGGIIALSVFQRRLPQERTFVVAVLGAGLCQLVAASMSTLTTALVFVALFGLCAGAVYVLGFTVLQGNVSDDLRGRIFATLYTLIRFCLLVSFVVAPILSKLLDQLSEQLVDGAVSLGGLTLSLPGVRLTLWLGGIVIVAAGLLARRSLSAPEPSGT